MHASDYRGAHETLVLQLTDEKIFFDFVASKLFHQLVAERIVNNTFAMMALVVDGFL